MATSTENTTGGEHIVRAYDDELTALNNAIIEMGGVTETQITDAITAVVKRDPKLAVAVIQNDDRVDELNYQVDIQATRLLALRQPMALDLRIIVGALKISADLERIADYAANIAKRSIPLGEVEPVKPVYVIPRMARLVSQMIKEVLDAFVERDVDKAIAVWNADEEVDEMYSSLFRELLTYMMENPRNITSCTHLLFIAKNIERIGDHVTNISETIYFLVNGTRMQENRPQKDRTDLYVETGPIGHLPRDDE